MEYTKSKIEIVIFSSWQTAPLLVDAERQHVARTITTNPHLVYRIRLINDVRLACYNLLYEHPFVEKQNKDNISILLIGSGAFGKEMFKALCWCSVLLNKTVDIYVVDLKMQEIKKELKLECPELDLTRSIFHFYELNTNSSDFKEFLDRDCENIDYIIVSLGDDQSTMSTGVIVSSHYLAKKRDRKPTIALRLREKIISDFVQIVSDTNRTSHRFEIFGATADLYSLDRLFNSKLRQSAEAIHVHTRAKIKNGHFQVIVSDQEERKELNDYFGSEYYQRTSYACALHLKYKQLITPYTSTPTEEEIKQEAISEHKRWCVYMQTEGYCKAGLPQMEQYYSSVHSHVNHDAKLTPCLVDWNYLPMIYLAVKRHNKNIVNFQMKDKAVIRYMHSKTD